MISRPSARGPPSLSRGELWLDGPVAGRGCLAPLAPLTPSAHSGCVRRRRHHFPAASGLASHWRVGERGHDAASTRGVSVRHLAAWFDAGFAESEAWRRCSAVVGLHPDEATEALVDLALAHRKPFAVVPCCVFWRTNLQREVVGSGAAAEGAGAAGALGTAASGAPPAATVKTWREFCDFLSAKAPGVIQRATLPMRGRNEVLFATFETGPAVH